MNTGFLLCTACKSCLVRLHTCSHFCDKRSSAFRLYISCGGGGGGSWIRCRTNGLIGARPMAMREECGRSGRARCDVMMITDSTKEATPNLLPVVCFHSMSLLVWRELGPATHSRQVMGYSEHNGWGTRAVPRQDWTRFVEIFEPTTERNSLIPPGNFPNMAPIRKIRDESARPHHSQQWALLIVLLGPGDCNDKDSECCIS